MEGIRNKERKLVSIRLTRELYEKLKEDAVKNHRSVSSHGAHIIERHFSILESIIPVED